jgi:hypothetical protein
VCISQLLRTREPHHVPHLAISPVYPDSAPTACSATLRSKVRLFGGGHGELREVLGN